MTVCELVKHKTDLFNTSCFHGFCHLQTIQNGLTLGRYYYARFDDLNCYDHNNIAFYKVMIARRVASHATNMTLYVT